MHDTTTLDYYSTTLHTLNIIGFWRVYILVLAELAIGRIRHWLVVLRQVVDSDVVNGSATSRVVHYRSEGLDEVKNKRLRRCAAKN